MLPSKFSMQDELPPIHPQGKLGSCAACSMLLVGEMILARNNKYVNLSKLFSFFMARKISNTLDKVWATPASTIEALVRYGSPPANMWPYIFENKNKYPPPSVINAASMYKIDSYEELIVDIASIKHHLVNTVPAIISFVPGGMFWAIKGPLDTQLYKPVNNTDNTSLYLHTTTIIGYDDILNGGSFIIVDSKGSSWGQNGIGALPYTCIADIKNGYYITSFAGFPTEKKFL